MRVSRSRTLAAASAIFGLIHWGCSCNEGLRDAAPKAAVFAADGGMAHEDDDGLYVLDFGRVALGLSREQSFRVRNDGASALELSAASVTGEQGSVFGVVREPSRLPPGGVAEVVVVFAPEMEGLAEARLTLQTNDREAPQLTFLLTGEGYDSALDISPKELHFGKVVLGTEVHLELRVDNPKSWEREVTLGDWQPASAPAPYRIEEGESERIVLGPHDSKTLTVIFAPDRVGLHSASFAIEPCVGCHRQRVALTGEGVSSGLVVEPEVLDFGDVLPGERRHRTVAFRNEANVAVNLTEIVLEQRFGDSDYSGFCIESLTFPSRLEAGEDKEVEVTFEPQVAGPHYSTQLRWTSSDPEAPDGTVLLLGYAVDARVSIAPSSLDFGGVGTDCPLRVREFCVRNEGAAKVMVKEMSILGDAQGAYAIPAPLSNSEISGGEQACVRVQFTPRAAGEFEAAVHVSVSGYAEPFVVGLSGEGLDEDAPWPSEGSGCLQGQVCSPGGGWLPGAEVLLRNANSNGVDALATKSDEQGYFYLEGVPVGTWDLRVETRSFSTEVEVQILDGRLTILDDPICVDADSAAIAVIYGACDFVQSVLARLGATNVEVFGETSQTLEAMFDLLTDIAKLGHYDMLLFNDNGIDISMYAEVQETLRAFVEGGGSLAASRRAWVYIHRTWPEVFEPPSSVVDVDASPHETWNHLGYLRGASIVDSFLAEAMGKSELSLLTNLRDQGFLWGAPLVSEDDRFRSLVEIDGLIFEDGPRNGVPYMSYFDYGKGRVGFSLHAIHHSYEQTVTEWDDGRRLLELFLLGL